MHILCNYTENKIIFFIIWNIATYFILVDKYVILNAVEELLTNENMKIFGTINSKYMSCVYC